jgi:hypothetical protein
MPGLGYGNPLPARLGGGLSDAEKQHRFLRACVGEGFAAAAGTIEDFWRWARARAWAAGLADERAVMQMFPDRATDAIPLFEELLRQIPAPGETDQERRDEATEAWTDPATAISPELLLALQAIDPAMSIVGPPTARTYDQSVETQHGRAFQDWQQSGKSCGPAFGNRSGTDWPGFSSGYAVVILYDIAPVVIPTAEHLAKIAQVRKLLDKVLPAWVDFEIDTSIGGFYCDISPLDYTAFA